jgi:catechol 2,3-dioxygenase-like lactoylglutathione lyase family enzyme
MKKNVITMVFVLLFVIARSLQAQNLVPSRPHITGISHVSFYVSDLSKARVFWHDFLGFDEPYDLPQTDDPGKVAIAFIKINDHQHIELSTAAPKVARNMLSHLCFTVDDIHQMHEYLRAVGVAVPPAITKTHTGDLAFSVKDPDGNNIEFMQSLPDGWETKAAGKFVPATRISNHIYHVGFMVGDTKRAMDFYSRILGFREIWRGSGDGKQLSWINMQLPDGADYVEFMLYGNYPPVERWGGNNHIALEVPDMAKALAALQMRTAATNYTRRLTINLGKNGKRQLNLYDPDGTRVELMEPHTASGQPAPSSTAPLPVKQ